MLVWNRGCGEPAGIFDGTGTRIATFPVDGRMVRGDLCGDDRSEVVDYVMGDRAHVYGTGPLGNTFRRWMRGRVLAAGQAVLAINQNAGYAGPGIYLSFLLVSAAGLIISLRSHAPARPPRRRPRSGRRSRGGGAGWRARSRSR